VTRGTRCCRAAGAAAIVFAGLCASVIPAAGAVARLPHPPAPAGRAGSGPSHASPWWGVDSASYAYDVLPGTEHIYGTPQVFGRYVTSYANCNGHGLTPAEVSYLFQAGIPIFLIDGTAECKVRPGQTYTAAEGTAAGQAAVDAAEALGVPAGVAIYEDIEYDKLVTPAFLVAYYDYVSSNSHYLPGFYGQTTNPDPADEHFDTAFCQAAGTDPSIVDALYWASGPANKDGRTGPSTMPPYEPGEFHCSPAVTATLPSPTSWQYAWQYGPVGPGGVNVDTDEVVSTVGLWMPPADGSFVESAGQLYRIAGGAPLPLTSWAAIGGKPAGAIITALPQGEIEDLQYPSNGTVLVSAQTGDRYVVSGGVALYSPSSRAAGTVVDPAALDHAGQSGIWSHLARPDGYWLVSADGTVRSADQATVYGSFTAGSAYPVVDVAASPDGGGYWLATRDGAVVAFGDARSYGDLHSEGVAAGDIVAIAPTADGRGYWLIGADGGVFCFGDARYHGSIPALGHSVDDVVGMVASPSAAGYTVVGADGGVFAFGATHYFGSLPGLGVRVDTIRALLPAPAGTGYILVGTDGGAFVFGHGTPFHGSLPGEGYVVDDVIGIALSGNGNGYWMATSSGSVYAFGDAGTPALSGSPDLPVAAIAGA
jgi:hypothetical protein